MNNLLLFVVMILISFKVQANPSVNIPEIFGFHVNQRPQNSDLNVIQQSRSLKNSLASFLFGLGDVNLNNRLSFNEFSTIYSHFIFILSSQPASTLLIQSRFNMGDHINSDNQLDLLEFGWVIHSDLQFISRNCLFGTNVPPRFSSYLENLEKTTDPTALKRIVQNIYSGVFNNAPIGKGDFKELLMYLSNTIGIVFGFNSCTIEGYMAVADLNKDEKIQLNELKKFTSDLITNLITILGNYATFYFEV